VICILTGKGISIEALLLLGKNVHQYISLRSMKRVRLITMRKGLSAILIFAVFILIQNLEIVVAKDARS